MQLHIITTWPRVFPWIIKKEEKSTGRQVPELKAECGKRAEVVVKTCQLQVGPKEHWLRGGAGRAGWWQRRLPSARSCNGAHKGSASCLHPNTTLVWLSVGTSGLLQITRVRVDNLKSWMTEREDWEREESQRQTGTERESVCVFVVVVTVVVVVVVVCVCVCVCVWWWFYVIWFVLCGLSSLTLFLVNVCRPVISSIFSTSVFIRLSCPTLFSLVSLCVCNV